MGAIVSISRLKGDYLSRTTLPLIFCSSPDWAVKLVEKAGFVPCNFNILLAEALLQYTDTQRSRMADAEIMRIASGLNAPVFFTDYQILFNPRYKIDPIKVFCQIARKQRVAVNWCGSLNNNTLEYSEPGYPDFCTFTIDNYDILCIK